MLSVAGLVGEDGGNHRPPPSVIMARVLLLVRVEPPMPWFDPGLAQFQLILISASFDHALPCSIPGISNWIFHLISLLKWNAAFCFMIARFGLSRPGFDSSVYHFA